MVIFPHVIASGKACRVCNLGPFLTKRKRQRKDQRINDKLKKIRFRSVWMGIYVICILWTNQSVFDYDLVVVPVYRKDRPPLFAFFRFFQP